MLIADKPLAAEIKAVSDCLAARFGWSAFGPKEKPNKRARALDRVPTEDRARLLALMPTLAAVRAVGDQVFHAGKRAAERGTRPAPTKAAPAQDRRRRRDRRYCHQDCSRKSQPATANHAHQESGAKPVERKTKGSALAPVKGIRTSPCPQRCERGPSCRPSLDRCNPAVRHEAEVHDALQRQSETEETTMSATRTTRVIANCEDHGIEFEYDLGLGWSWRSIGDGTTTFPWIGLFSTKAEAAVDCFHYCGFDE
jgi:hypothetical protein